MHEIKQAVGNYFNGLCHDIAEAIDNGNWMAAICKIGLAGVILGSIAVLLLLLLTLLLKLLGSLLWKVLAGPLVLLLFGLSYKANLNGTERERIGDPGPWAESVYDCVRDAMFLVLRAASDYTPIIRPTSPGAVELPNNISIKDGYAVFSFFARVSTDVDVPKLKRELTRTLGQMLRAHELPGLPSDLVQINGSYYCPLQIFDIVDFGDSINISVVFSDEKTVELVKARKMLHLEKRELRTRSNDTLYDDEL